MSAKIGGTLPKGDARFHVLLAIVDCKKVATDYDTGEIVPTARIRRVEVVLPQDLAAAEKLLRRALEKRAGLTVLPMDLEDEITIAFGRVDPRTGEVLGDPDGESGRCRVNVSLRAQRVYAGIAVMDEKHGEDWVFKVDPDTLDMSEPCGCVVGQFYGGTGWWDMDDRHDDPNRFEAGVRAMGLDSLAQRQCGFYTVEGGDVGSGSSIAADYDALTRIWAYAIRRLRERRGGAE